MSKPGYGLAKLLTSGATETERNRRKGKERTEIRSVQARRLSMKPLPRLRQNKQEKRIEREIEEMKTPGDKLRQPNLEE